ncbi:hypothetical protein ACU21_01995 [Actinobaculum suis]|uniref:mannose-1-phosphate guanylyltransferase n=1 Tax=Actinobaculum suis TaxID=1657 RepID=UPI00080876FE|nr:sugar phosphate nucleotidyltransferase [Actinobaculum suis]OCA96252.1 hypothetical protein ACU21_01995 [Actinobaculum suis]
MAFHAIIPAGGAGTRLWPLSRAGHPKFLVDLTGTGRTMLQATADRLSPLSDSLLVVTGSAHADAVRTQLASGAKTSGAKTSGVTTSGVTAPGSVNPGPVKPGPVNSGSVTPVPATKTDAELAAPPSRAVVEPQPRGTMAAIGLAAALLEREYGECVVGSFAADHAIGNVPAFQEAVRTGIRAATAGYVVTIGITPEYPATGFGYIHGGANIANLPGVCQVESFVEKPDAQRAATYLAQGGYFWNAGMFIANTSVLLGALERFRPDIAIPLREIAAAWDLETDTQSAAVRAAWEKLPAEVIDRAIAEPLAATGGVAVVPAAMDWSDVGDYASVAAQIPGPQRTHQVAPGGSAQETIAIDSEGALIYTHDKPIAVLGLEGGVVVDTGEVLLVSTRQAAHKVKDVTEILTQRGLDHLR